MANTTTVNNTPTDILKDLEMVSRIPVVSTILEVICRTTGMGFATIARVTEDRWVTCAVKDEIAFGLLPGDELQLKTTICHEIRQNHQAVVIDHVTEDTLYAGHHTPAQYGFQSYISFPIILKDGTFFGTLCAIDPKPNQLNNTQIRGMFKLFAELIAFHLQAMEQLTLTETRLQEERKTAELREQFIAVLGHDMANPLAAITGSAQLLQQMPLEQEALHFVRIIQQSGHRITGLIDNVLDFAQDRMGEGMVLHCKSHEIAAILGQVVSETRMIWPGRIIQTKLDLEQPVYCDGNRIAQLFANLLSNALKYGKADSPVIVEAQSNAAALTLSVSNAGERIPEATMTRLFQPFFRGHIVPDQKGLGLGLYIASAIARAHRGRLEVASDNTTTKFTFYLPASQDTDDIEM